MRRDLTAPATVSPHFPRAWWVPAEARSNLEIEDGSQWRAQLAAVSLEIVSTFPSLRHMCPQIDEPMAQPWRFGHSCDIKMLADLRPLVCVFRLW
jgi:hypothetical protein